MLLEGNCSDASNLLHIIRRTKLHYNVKFTQATVYSENRDQCFTAACYMSWTADQAMRHSVSKSCCVSSERVDYVECGPSLETCVIISPLHGVTADCLCTITSRN